MRGNPAFSRDAKRMRDGDVAHRLALAQRA